MSSEIHVLPRAQMMQAAAMLLKGMTLAEVASEVGVPKGRISSWKKNPAFQEIYADLEAKLAAAVETELVADVASEIARLTPDAIQVLQEGLQASKESDRLGTAKFILSYSKPRADQAPTTIEAAIRNKASGVSPSLGD